MILETILIRLFCNSLRPSIRTQAKQNGCHKNSWEQAFKKAITANAKAAFNLLSRVQEMEVCCSWGYQSSPKADKRTKKKVFNWNFSSSQKPKPQLFQCSKNTKTLNKPWKDHRNNRRNTKNFCDYGLYSPKLLGSTLATGVNKNNSFTWNNCNCNRLLK